MQQSFFITGTDTGVGKTWITTVLLAGFRQQGKSTVALKPIASGVTPEGGNEDAQLLMSYASIKCSMAEVNPCCLTAPIAPSIAASRDNKSLSVEKIWQDCQPLLQKSADIVLVEGVGGWNVPLNDQETTVDLAKKFGFPVILVVGLRLGCLNHALLAYQSIGNAGLPLAGWVANQVDPQMEAVKENIETLQHFLKIPYLGFVPFLEDLKAVDAVGFLDLSAFVGGLRRKKRA